MEEKRSEKRLIELDVVRGIAIIAMIMGHSWIEIPYVGAYIYSFHMPIFFFISGYFFKSRPFGQEMWHSFRTLLVPFLLIRLVFLTHALYRIISKDILVFGGEGGLITITHEAAFQYFIAKSWYVIGPTWFLLALFWGKIVFNLLHRFTPERYLWLPVFILSLGAYYLIDYLPFQYRIGQGLVAVLGIYLGYLTKRHNLLEKSQSNPIFFPCLLAWLVITPFTFSSFAYLDFTWGMLPAYAIALLGSFVCIGIAKRYIARTQVLQSELALWGRYSILVFVSHVGLVCVRQITYDHLILPITSHVPFITRSMVDIGFQVVVIAIVLRLAPSWRATKVLFALK